VFDALVLKVRCDSPQHAQRCAALLRTKYRVDVAVEGETLLMAGLDLNAPLADMTVDVIRFARSEATVETMNGFYKALVRARPPEDRRSGARPEPPAGGRGDRLAAAALELVEKLAAPAKKNMKTRTGVVHAPGERGEMFGGSRYRPLCETDPKNLTLTPTRRAVTCYRCQVKLNWPNA